MKQTAKYILLQSIFIVCLILTTALTINAQDNKSQLAFEYFRNQNYEKAAITFKELYEENKRAYFRTYYIASLIKNNQLDEAEKFVRKELRKNKDDVDLNVEQAYIVKQQGKDEKANKLFEEIIERFTTTPQSTKNLANIFIRKQEFSLAEQTYKTGKEVNTGQDFYLELANLYAIERKYPEMIDAYFNLLDAEPSYQDLVQSRLQSQSLNDIDNNLNAIIETALIKRIQKKSSPPVFTEMLIWQYIQTGKYDLAVQHATALDKRQNGLGRLLFELGEIATNNGQQDVAKTCFEKVYKYGKTSPWYFKAKLIELNSLYQSAMNKNTLKDLQDLEQLIINTSNEAPRKLQAPLIKLLVQIQAFHLEKTTEALHKIDSTIQNMHLSNEDLIDFKLLQGDIYLLDENPWEATLIYAKIEQDNKNNPFGAEAKFRKAKLAYYTGQFEWAKSQLDVLKASTSKLISNDAFELSLFISENSTEDSLQIALEMFARADLFQLKKDFSGSLQILDSIQNKFPTDNLMDDVLFRKASIQEKLGNYNQAIDLYNLVATDYSWEILADNALINMARIQHHKLQNAEEAKATYTQLLLHHKGSIFTEEARNAIRELRGDFSKEEKEK